MTETINLVWWNLEPHLSYEKDWLNLLLSGFKVNHIVDPDHKIHLDNTVIVASLSQIFFSGPGARKEYAAELKQLHSYIRHLKREGMKVGLFHLGDELYRESTDFYQDLDFIFRQYYKAEDHKKYANCYYLPIGYKSGFCDKLVHRSIYEREHLWSFAGHLKGSRYEMMKYAKAIAGGRYHITTQWNDPNALTTGEYAELLNNTRFSLCPMGNYSVDCFRVYESLEAGTIPIVEAKGTREALAVLFNPRFLFKYGTWDQRFWLRNYRYWEQAFRSEFPCPLIYEWKHVEALMNSIDAENMSEKIGLWWKEYKHSLIHTVQSAIEAAFS